MPPLIQLPTEITTAILSFTDPKDLAQVNLTCKYLYGLVKDNASLFRTMYLHLIDGPPEELDWVGEVKDLARFRAICASSDPPVSNKKQGALPYHLFFSERPQMSMAYQAGRGVDILRDCFANNRAVQTFMCRSFIFQRARAPIQSFDQPKQPPTREQQMSAKLHCLFGDMVLNYGRTRSTRAYPFACSKLYDIREYTQRTRWGPFLDEGPGPIRQGFGTPQLVPPADRVDWEKVEAIMIVLWANMKEQDLDRLPIFNSFWGIPFAGCWPNSYLPLGLDDQAEIEDVPEDPYGISGTYLRIICFLDYNDYYAFNFPPHDLLPDHVPRPSLDETEATRVLVMKIWVTKVDPPGPEDHQDYPVVHLKGITRSLDASWPDSGSSNLKGSVRMTREGEVHWTTYSIFDGESRWRSEGIQLGGMKSSKVIGTWFDANYDPSGPCGPSAFWKIGDRLVGSDNGDITKDDCLPIIEAPDPDSNVPGLSLLHGLGLGGYGASSVQVQVGFPF
ncbi:hypothetical protein M406DRAFT_328781 [Cryphonectria parasitica EP155]|uniref:F-box domain-containing protein n=1 Tax=Cryphonectria parasitica (strain ATCC 38755 / EP155) TaxID=660469 RepID=A0A9P4Y6A7_CRYP1|nr:uncharacterized protein M406DRAFT_328781 [Cryphonectria parasitica EP155]KAF3767722.1 hypothetical protein M406DRAFT_328781 [Cryphonectria parasitica EP155]